MPTIPMNEFWKLPEVVKCTEIQKTTPFFNPKHKEAAIKLREIADTYGAGKYFGNVEEDYAV